MHAELGAQAGSGVKIEMIFAGNTECLYRRGGGRVFPEAVCTAGGAECGVCLANYPCLAKVGIETLRALSIVEFPTNEQITGR